MKGRTIIQILLGVVIVALAYLLYNSIYDSVLSCGRHAAMPDPYRRYAAHFIAGGISGVVRQYCGEEPPVSVEALYEIMRKLFSGQIDL